MTLFFVKKYFVLLLLLVITPKMMAQNTPDRRPIFSDLLPNHAVYGCIVCEADFSLEQERNIQSDLEDLQKDLANYLGVPMPREKIILCLFSEWKAYNKFLIQKFPTAPRDRPALYVKGNGPGILMVIRDEQMRLNIRHEMTHAILNASLRNVPIWIDEGLAKYFETPKGARGYKNPFLEPVRKSAQSWFRKVPSLPRLEKLQRIDQMGIREYRESWAWTHFLIHYSRQTQQLLAHYLLRLQPDQQEELTPQQVTEYQMSEPMTELLKEMFPDYKQAYIEHFKEWTE